MNKLEEILSNIADDDDEVTIAISMLRALSSEHRMKVLDEAGFCKHCGEDFVYDNVCYCYRDE